VRSTVAITSAKCGSGTPWSWKRRTPGQGGQGGNEGYVSEEMELAGGGGG
jgi:hypothetical protein